MVPDDVIARAMELSRTQRNFTAGDPWTQDDLKAVERALGRPLPRTWARFFQVFGNGSFEVKGRGYFDSSAPECEAGRRFKTADAEDWSREENFDVFFCAPQSYSGKDPWHGIGEWFEGGWLTIGRKPDGDSLILRIPAPTDGISADGEVAWLNHEIALRTYRWPGFVEFWQHMLELDADTPEEEKQ